MFNLISFLNSIKRNCLSLKDIALKLGISEATLRKKLYHGGDFTNKEICNIATILSLSSDEIIAIFFCKQTCINAS